jgi:hypothetical protein
MGRFKIGAAYKSGWYVVVIPTLFFLIILLGMPALLHALGLKATNHVILGLVLGFVVGIAACIYAYKFLLKMATEGNDEISIEGSVIKWKRGDSWKSLDLGSEHLARINSGPQDAFGEPAIDLVIHNKTDSVGICMHGRGRDAVLKLFPHEHFISETNINHGEGFPEFDLQAGIEKTDGFFNKLLASLWTYRKFNEAFETHGKFPWKTHPEPAFTHIREVIYKQGPDADREFIDILKKESVSSPVPWLCITPDYVVGYTHTDAEFFMDIVTGNNDPESYFVMPLGQVSADEPVLKPDFAQMFVRAMLKSNFHEGDVFSLIISGTDDAGHEMKIEFPWPGASGEGSDERSAFIKFINRKI